MAMLSRGRAGEPQAVQVSDALVADVRRVLRTELLRDTCSAAGIARLFSMHRRTMSRYLLTRGFTFRQVANEVRFEIACDLLENTDMALGQIAAALRYSEPSAFTRAFRRWCGQSPSDWRASHPHARTSRRSWRSHRPRPDPEPTSQDGSPDRVIITG
jgi:AraC-like DNA-binding protein